MNKYKYLLSISMLGLCSQLSVAAVLDTSPLSANMSQATEQPLVIEFFIRGKSGENISTGRIFFTPTDTVAQVKEYLITRFRRKGDIGFMIGNEEVMKNLVRSDGTLVTLEEALQRTSGLVEIIFFYRN
jgi:hypothetical protein